MRQVYPTFQFGVEVRATTMTGKSFWFKERGETKVALKMPLVCNRSFASLSLSTKAFRLASLSFVFLE